MVPGQRDGDETYIQHGGNEGHEGSRSRGSGTEGPRVQGKARNPGTLTLPRLKAGDARFLAAAYATAPRRLCPSRSMFLAALWSRCRRVPQVGQECHRTERPLETSSPHLGPEQRWL